MLKEKLITRYEIDGLKMKVTRDTVSAEGHDRWIAVRYLDSNESRIAACQWYVGLVAKGIMDIKEK